MLTQIRIKNYVLIHFLEINFSENLNVITGETGTGKSILLGALGLLVGNRVSAKVVANNQKKCTIEGTFNITPYNLHNLFEEENLDYENLSILRREVTAEGKSRSFINDTPVTLYTMKKIGGRLMDIHSQHENVDIKKPFHQLHILDLYASNKRLKYDYKQAWEEWTNTKKEYEELIKKSTSVNQELDYLIYQLDELTQAQLQKNELEPLEEEIKIQEHAEEIKKELNTTLERLDNNELSVYILLNESLASLRSVANRSEYYTPLYTRLESLFFEFKDILEVIKQEESQVDIDNQKTETTRERIDLINQLLHKHQCQSIDQLLQLKEDLERKVFQHKDLKKVVATTQQKIVETEALARKTGEALSVSRQAFFTPMCTQLVVLMNQLGMPHAKLKVAHEQVPLNATGIDTIAFLFSANKGIKEQPLATIISGGELSRFMFCIRYLLAEKTNLPTLILDEIDAGIAGEIAIRMSAMMQSMAKKHQLIAISHLPQIAARASIHFYVYKQTEGNKTKSAIKALNPEEQVEEIAKMISGDTPSPSAIKNAKELIQR